MLFEVQPGSLVAIHQGDDIVMVELGNLLGGEKKKKTTTWWGALVRTLDRETLEPIHSTTRIIDPDARVECMIISASRRRELFMMNSRVRVDVVGEQETDPMQAAKRGSF